MVIFVQQEDSQFRILLHLYIPPPLVADLQASSRAGP